MPAEIEAIAVELDGLRDAPDHAVGLVDDGRTLGTGEHVGGRQPGRSTAEHDRSRSTVELPQH